MSDEKKKGAVYVITWQVFVKALAVFIAARILMMYFPLFGLGELGQSMLAGAIGALALFSIARKKNEDN